MARNKVIDILFVEDNQEQISLIREILEPMQDFWFVDFAASIQDVISRFSKQTFDIVVSDMQMSGMAGIEILEWLRKKSPQTVRIALTDNTNKNIDRKIVKSAHQFITKPIIAGSLKMILQRACDIREILSQEEIKSLVSRLRTLPSLPMLYLEIMEELQQPEASSKRIGQIISRDPSMSAKVLQLVNSAYFGVRQYISNPSQATALLGIETIRDLMLSIYVFSQFNPVILDRLNLNSLWEHSIIVGASAKMIAKIESGNKEIIDQSFIAGLLHDIGKLILAENLPTKYYYALGFADRKRVELYQGEKDVFDATHMQAGAYLLGLWGMPEPVIEAVAFHHTPMSFSENRSFTPSTAVHVANVLAHKYMQMDWAKIKPEFDMCYLSENNLDTRLPIWEKAFEEAAYYLVQ